MNIDPSGTTGGRRRRLTRDSASLPATTPMTIPPAMNAGAFFRNSLRERPESSLFPRSSFSFFTAYPIVGGATPDFGPHYIRMCAEGTASPPGKNPSRFGNRRVRSSLGLQQSPLCPVVLFVDDLF